MDFFRTRAVPALGAALLAAATPVSADCSALNGLFSDESTEKPGGSPRTLSALAPAKERARLYRSEAPASPQPGFASGATRARPKVTRLSSTVRVTYKDGQAKLAFMDADGKLLVEAPLAASPGRWKCVGNRLERRFETVGGLGERVRTERTTQALFAEKAGDLHLQETASIVETPGAGERRTEVTFRRVEKR